MKIAYKKCILRAAQREVVEQANEILEEYKEQGYILTLRQLYYQFVARAILPNTLQSYKRVGGIINEGRLGGLVDWSLLEDRTRNLEKLASWDSPADIVEACATQYRRAMWDDQPCYVEVWVEKEALAGIIEQACSSYRVPYLSCRGYVSQSEMWRASRRLKLQERSHDLLILHLGDHDPSGIDMSRDIEDRLNMFLPHIDLEVKRIALNMDQVQEYNPPPNPAKTTDARFASYQKKYGVESWELDALEPKVITDLIQDELKNIIDPDVWRASMKHEAKGKRVLEKIVKELR